MEGEDTRLTRAKTAAWFPSARPLLRSGPAFKNTQHVRWQSVCSCHAAVPHGNMGYICAHVGDKLHSYRLGFKERSQIRYHFLPHAETGALIYDPNSSHGDPSTSSSGRLHGSQRREPIQPPENVLRSNQPLIRQEAPGRRVPLLPLPTFTEMCVPPTRMTRIVSTAADSPQFLSHAHRSSLNRVLRQSDRTQTRSSTSTCQDVCLSP